MAFGSSVPSVWARKPQQRFYSWSDMFTCKMRLPSHHPHYASISPFLSPTFLHIVLFWDQESQSQFHCQKASIMEVSVLTASNVLCHWPQYKWRAKTKHWALSLVSYCLCVLISLTQQTSGSLLTLSASLKICTTSWERGKDQRVMRGKETERGRNG